MARHKRMQYDPPGQRKHRKPRDPSLRADQIIMSRRALIMKGGVVAAFITMATKLGIMQLAEGDQYKKSAEENVVSRQFLPAPRGLILDRLGRPLAQNRRSWELRLTPALLPDEETEKEQYTLVIDSLVSALQLEDTLVVQEAAIPPGSTHTVFSRIAAMLGYTGDDATRMVDIWSDQLTREIYLNVTPNGGLSIDDAARFRAASNELPGVMVMNVLEWQIKNMWNPRAQVTVARDIPRETALKLEANKMYLPGVELDDNALVRDYVGGEVMSHIIGYVQTIPDGMINDPRWKGKHGERLYEPNDVIGRDGLEIALETTLRGSRGERLVEMDASRIIQRELPHSRKEPVAGKNVYLTIDLEFQEAVGTILQKYIELAAEGKRTQNAQRAQEGKKQWQIPNAGSAVVYDPRTGEVLAMVSYPFYDNQLFVSGISNRKWNEYLDETTGKAFLNRSVNELYPPGSTFKIFLLASALDGGFLTEADTHVCRGAIAVPSTGNYNERATFACWVGWLGSGEGHGELDFYGAIEQSCDVFFYNVVQDHWQPADAVEPVFYWDVDLLTGNLYNADDKKVFNGMGIDPIHTDMTTRFCFGKETGIEIAEAVGLVPSPAWKLDLIGESWNVGDNLNISIGQGDFLVTPLQMAFNTGILAAGGEIHTPHLVRSMRMDPAYLAATPGASPVAPPTPRPSPTPTSAPTPTIDPLSASVEPAPNDTPVPTAGPTPTPYPIGEKRKPDGSLGMKADTLDKIREAMRRVVHGDFGTARVNGDGSSKWPMTNDTPDDEITIAGKTGTAEYGEEDDLGARDSHAWFTCFAPLEAPEVAISVIIEKGGEGATFAVPAADEILRAYLELTGRRPRGKVLSTDPKPI